MVGVILIVFMALAFHGFQYVGDNGAIVDDPEDNSTIDDGPKLTVYGDGDVLVTLTVEVPS